MSDITETLSVLRDYIARGKQVVYVGRIKWFDVYTVGAANAQTQKRIMQMRELPKHKTGKEVLGTSLRALEAHIAQATNKLEKLGVRKTKTNLIIADNVHGVKTTGGDDAGGFTAKKLHAIVISLEVADSPKASEVIVHEFAHTVFYAMPKATKRYVEAWYNKHVRGSVVVPVAKVKSSDLDLVSEVRGAYDTLSRKYSRENKDARFRVWSDHKFMTSLIYSVISQTIKKQGSKLKSEHVSDVLDLKTSVLDSIENTRIVVELTDGDYETVLSAIILGVASRLYTLGSWESQSKEDLSTRGSQELRNQLKAAGIVPSAYAASNHEELWAETFRFAAFNLQKVNPLLKDLLKRVLQGNINESHTPKNVVVFTYSQLGVGITTALQSSMRESMGLDVKVFSGAWHSLMTPNTLTVREDYESPKSNVLGDHQVYNYVGNGNPIIMATRNWRSGDVREACNAFVKLGYKPYAVIGVNDVTSMLAGGRIKESIASYAHWLGSHKVYIIDQNCVITEEAKIFSCVGKVVTSILESFNSMLSR